MKKISGAGFLLIVFMSIAIPATATLTTFSTTENTDRVYFSVNDNGFYVKSTQIPSSATSPGLNATSFISGSNFALSAATSSPYTDAGIVLYFNGGLTLGALQSVSITSSIPLSMNLWLDTGGDGQFFAFDNSGKMTSLNNDTYGIDPPSALYNANSQFYMQGAITPGQTWTLAQLQSGTVAGINSNTQAALWIGTTGPFSANISSVQVSTVSIPGAVWLLGSGLFGLIGFRKRPGRKSELWG